MQTTARALALWSPLLAHIRVTTGIDLRFETAKDIPTYELRLAAGAYDFVYENPYHYVTFSQHYKLLARDDRKIQGILVVRDDSRFHTVEDLRGETIAFPGPASFAATLLVQTELRKRGIAYQSEYVGSHDSVYESVSVGLFSAGGGIQKTFNSRSSSSTNNLRILMTTPQYMPHVFAVQSRVPPEVAVKVRTALLKMHLTKAGSKLLQDLGLHEFVAGDDKEYDDIRALKINLLRQSGRSP